MEESYKKTLKRDIDMIVHSDRDKELISDDIYKLFLEYSELISVFTGAKEDYSNSLKWWYSIPFEQRFLKTIDWLSSQNRDTTEIHPNTLSPTEIYQIYTMFYN